MRDKRILLQIIHDKFQDYQKANFEKQPKYIVVYQIFKESIVALDFPEHSVLPSTRELSKSLNLARATICKSFELLELEKLIIAKAGSGYFVRHVTESRIQEGNHKPSKNDLKYPKVSKKGEVYFKNKILIERDDSDQIAFRPGLPPLDAFPINKWINLVNLYWRNVRISGLSYSKSSGQQELKIAICNYLSIARNIRCTADQIVIVSGSLQSLYLIANSLIDPDDQNTVALENPVFPNVYSVFKSSGAKILSIPLDQDGLNLNELQKQAETPPKIIHVTPTNQYPLGIQMTLQRRRELLEYASDQGSFIIENDYENEIACADQPIQSIFSLDSEDRTIYLGTFNRLLHPSIRLGYMIVPRVLKPYIETLQDHSHRFVPPSMQMVLKQFIEKNHLYKHINYCIELARERNAIFENEFDKFVTKMKLLYSGGNSFHRVALFCNPTDEMQEQKLVSTLRSNGIETLSLSKCYHEKPKVTGLIIGYAAARPSVIVKKVEIMASIINEL